MESARANNQVILTSELYNSRDGAKAGIESCKRNSGLADRYARKTSSKNEPYFVLLAGSNEPIGRCEMYSTVTAMENGIALCMANGPGGEFVHQT